jgi:hypothetical protein
MAEWALYTDYPGEPSPIGTTEYATHTGQDLSCTELQRGMQVKFEQDPSGEWEPVARIIPATRESVSRSDWLLALWGLDGALLISDWVRGGCFAVFLPSRGTGQDCTEDGGQSQERIQRANQR